MEKVSDVEIGGYAVKPEIWIGFKFLDDNGIEEPWRPEEHEKLKRILDKCEPNDRMLFTNAVCSTFKAVNEIAKRKEDKNDF